MASSGIARSAPADPASDRVRFMVLDADRGAVVAASGFDRERRAIGTAIEDFARVHGADHVTGVSPLTIFADAPAALDSPFATARINTIFFSSRGSMPEAIHDPSVVGHEMMHLVLDRLVPAPVGSRLTYWRVGEDRAVREGLADVAGALHARSWALGARAGAADAVRTYDGVTSVLHAARAGRIGAVLDPTMRSIHSRGGVVTDAFAGARQLGWGGVETLFASTVRRLASGEPRLLTFRGVEDALRGAAHSMGPEAARTVAAAIGHARL